MTKFVVGGVYRRQGTNGALYGMIVSATHQAHGKRAGNMTSHGFPDSTVIEDTTSLNEWELFALPSPPSVMSKVEKASESPLVAKLQELEERIVALNERIDNIVEKTSASPVFGANSGADEPEESESEVHPLAALAAARQRRKAG